jgi:ATP-dependent DNA helicase RecG
MVSGSVKNGGFTNPEFKVLKPGEALHHTDLNAVTYPVTNGITSRDIGRLVSQVLPSVGANMAGIRRIHQPTDQAEADAARNILKYDELLYFQLGLAVRQSQQAGNKPNVQCVVSSCWDIADYFPFKFTPDQKAAINDIVCDLTNGLPMNRLLQGDVSSGKTCVAAYAAILVAFNGAQTAILCPTEILARQHYKTIKGYFDRAGVTCRLVTSGTCVPVDDPHQPQYGDDILVGTTALLMPEIGFHNLGLVVVDELHKFGVEQRAALGRHGHPHMLSMSATPIPRTLAMTVFGDLDISVIKSMPPGREPVKTYWLPALNGFRSPALGAMNAKDILARQLSADHQVYVVCPRIEALDDEMRAVEEVSEEYAELFPDATTGMLHGRMTPEEKQRVSRWWSDPPTGGGRILVSTTVVEVGVDNPNATVMVIEGADRFGLAQLHQLRGRVGRGGNQSYCFLLSDTDSAEAKSRLRIMEKTNDGFVIAEHDLKMRGMGDLLSTRQHGLPDLRLADLAEDFDLMLEARKKAFAIVESDPTLAGHADMRAELLKRFGNRLQLRSVL